MVCSLYGATDIVRPFKGRLVGAPLWGCLLCAPLWGVFVGAPLWGRRCVPLWDVFPAPLYGATGWCAPLWGVFPVPLYGATVDHVGVCALPIRTGFAVGMPPVSRVL